MINILVPIAGVAKTFKEKGYIFPKPLIEVKNKPMIQLIYENLKLNMEHRFIFIVRKVDYEEFALGDVLKMMIPDSLVVVLNGETKGAACSALMAAHFIKGSNPLLIANGDQYLDVDLSTIVRKFLDEGVDGGIITFESVHPKWSFVRVDRDGFVLEAAEKKPISKHATAGVYFFKKGDYFIEAAQSMIRKDVKTMDQFFICPTYNEMILKGMKIKTVNIDNRAMYGLGTPEDIAEFEKKQVSRKILK